MVKVVINIIFLSIIAGCIDNAKLNEDDLNCENQYCDSLLFESLCFNKDSTILKYKFSDKCQYGINEFFEVNCISNNCVKEKFGENGRLLSKGTCLKIFNKRSKQFSFPDIGPWEDYYETGEVFEKYFIEYARKEGPSITFHKNGNIKSILHWKNGVLDGKEHLYDSLGIYFYVKEYKNDSLISATIVENIK